MLFWVMGEFENTCIVWRKWDISRAIPILYGWVYKTLKTFPSSGWTYGSGYDCRFSIKIIPEWILWVVNFDSGFMKFLFRISECIKFWDPVEESDTSEVSSITVRMEYLFVFQFWYIELCVENQFRGRQKVFFCYFLFFGGTFIVARWGVVEWVGESYLGPPEITAFSSQDFSRSNKHDTFWHVDSTGYFYVLFLWAIAVLSFKN